MKTLIPFTLVSLLIIIFSCNKAPNLNSDMEYIVGDWQWKYSVVSETETVTPIQDGNEYGIRIKKNGKIFLFMNEEVSKKGTYYVHTNIPNRIVASFDGGSIDFVLVGSNLQSTSFPFECLENTFYKQ